ncbi:MAG TPA: hypothetical protein VF791_20785 [Pyrinomonadaceae bacterium]
MKTPKVFALGLALALAAFTIAACGSGNSTPTKAFQTLYTAMKNKDVKAYKSVMPKKMLEMLEKAAKETNKSVDEFLGETLKDAPGKLTGNMPETRNEVIAADGKTATLEVKDLDSGNWRKLEFIKEDDGWKISR